MRLKLPVLLVVAFVCFFSVFPRAESQNPQPSSNFGGLLGAPYYATGGTGANPLIGLVAGDFNHDGLPDLAALTPVGNIEVFLNDGKGRLKAPLVSNLQLLGPDSYSSVGKVVAADLNGDGYADLVVGIGSFSQNTTLFVALNQKDGTFATATALTVPFVYGDGGPISFSFAVGPTTASGFPDIVAAGPGAGFPFDNTFQVATYLNDGKGGFSQNIFSSYPIADPSVLGGPQQSFGETVALADANHDGKADFFVVRQGFESAVIYVDVLLGMGDGSFATPSPNGAISLGPPVNGVGSISLAVTDLTGDANKQDIVLANSDGVWVALSNGDGTYQTPTTQVSFPYTYGVETTDLNGDGKPDLIISGDGGQSNYLGKGDGTFSSLAGAYVAGSNYPYFPVGYPSLRPAVADFNGDGIPDFASADLQIGGIEVASGNGDGTFEATPLLTSTQNPALVTGSIATGLVADLNGDGLDDIVANEYLAATPQIITGLADGHGGFKYQTALAASYPVDGIQPIRGDFNGDGKQDVVIAGADGSVAVALSNGDGTLKTPVPISLGKTLACQIGDGATGDLNGDKKLDLVFPYTGDMYCNKGSAVPSGYFVALGNGDGTFQPASFTPYGTYLASLALAAFHGSTEPLDIVASDYDATVGVALLAGKGDGTFGSPSVVTSTQLAYQVLTNDFNQDGKADLTLIGYTFEMAPTGSPNGAVVWYPGQGDGIFGPPVALYPGGNAFSGAYADLNGDGFLDLIVTSNNGLSVLLGAGGGSFASPIDYFSPAYGSPVLSGNFLGDNTQSILAFAGISGGTGFYKNLGGTSFVLTAPSTSFSYGQTVSLMAALTPTISGRPEPSGTVNFYDGTVSVGTGTAPNATLDLDSLATGTHTLTAVYAGDVNFNPNTSSALTVTVSQASTTTTLTASSQNVIQGTSVTFAATVAGANGTGTPTGSVSFMNGSAALGSGVLNSSGVATLTTSSLAVGSASITAAYAGDSSFAPSTSSAVTITVTAPLPPTFAVSATAVTAAAGATSGNTSTITVTPANGFTGSVNLSAALTSSPSGAVDLPTISLAASSVTVAGTSVVTTTATISTMSSISSSLAYPLRNRWYKGAGGVVLACIAFFAVPRRRRQWFWTATVASFVIAFGVAGCGGGGSKVPSNPGTTPGNYVFTVTGTDAATGKITVTGSVNVTVN